MRPLLRADARPIKDEWKIKPYFGVFPRVLSALRTNHHKSEYLELKIYMEESFRGKTLTEQLRAHMFQREQNSKYYLEFCEAIEKDKCYS